MVFNFFPDLLKGFGARHGDVEIEVVCAPTTELHLQLQRRRTKELVSILCPKSFVTFGTVQVTAVREQWFIEMRLVKVLQMVLFP